MDDASGGGELLLQGSLIGIVRTPFPVRESSDNQSSNEMEHESPAPYEKRQIVLRLLISGVAPYPVADAEK